MKSKKDKTKSTISTNKEKNKFFRWLKKSGLLLLFFGCAFGGGYLTNYLVNKNNQVNIQTSIQQELAILKKINIVIFLNDLIYTFESNESNLNFPTNSIELTQLNPINFDLTNLILLQTTKLDAPVLIPEMTVSLQFQTSSKVLFNIESSQILNTSDFKFDPNLNTISIRKIRLFLTNLIVSSQNKDEFSSNLTFELLS